MTKLQLRPANRLMAVFILLNFFICAAAFADNILRPGTPKLDRPTLTALGVQLPVAGDDNYNSTVSVQYRVAGSQTWKTGLSLFRVHPETVASYMVAQQFAGSIFDLRPGTAYEIQLHAVDPDGVDQTLSISGKTRGIPGDPAKPRQRAVADGTALKAALNTAVAGDVITLANGTYSGTFGISSSGTADNPIVIRGASQDGVILDGGNCIGCNILEIYGAGYVHVEKMTMQNAERAIRLQQDGTSGVVIRRVHIKNTSLGIGGRSNQNDTYIADNILEGRMTWPSTYLDDGGKNANMDGIAVYGSGVVVAHNRISGYGDAMKTEQDGARANDFYGNDILYTYDNGIELDGSEGNTRAFRNRFMNTYTPLSVQPIHGGPSYLFRNVVVNIAGEQIKFHAVASVPLQEPSGVLVYHNTFVSPYYQLNLQTGSTSHYFEIENNLFIAPATNGPQVVDWTGPIDHGTFDYNGYFPNGVFRYNNPLLGGYFLEQNFAALQQLGMERNGVLATGAVLASVTAPADYHIQMQPVDATLASGSSVLDRGRVLPNINDGYQGNGPDLGALERGCPLPTYGPRAQGVDESNEVVGCASTGSTAPVQTSVSVTPSQANIAGGKTQQFTAATVPSSSFVTWTLSPSRGSITQTGLYTAPADAADGETVTVKATAANGSFMTSAVSLLGSGDFTVTALQYDSPALGETGTFPVLITSTGYAGVVRFNAPVISGNSPAPAAGFSCSAASVTVPANGTVIANVNCLIPSNMSAPAAYFDGVQTTYPSYSISVSAVAGANTHAVSTLKLVPRPWSTPGLPVYLSTALSITPVKGMMNTLQTLAFQTKWDDLTGQAVEFRFQDGAAGPSVDTGTCTILLAGDGSGGSLNSNSGPQQITTGVGQGRTFTEANLQCMVAFPLAVFNAGNNGQMMFSVPASFSPMWFGKTIHLYVRSSAISGAWSGWKDLGSMKF